MVTLVFNSVSMKKMNSITACLGFIYFCGLESFTHAFTTPFFPFIFVVGYYDYYRQLGFPSA